VCLPPNSTDKLQPLDVGVFAPLKAAWKAVLTDYKQQHPRQAGIDKSDFPLLLKKTLIKGNLAQHLPAAFEKCGLYPVNKDKAVERIPHREMEVETENMRRMMDSTLGEKLEEMRGMGKKAERKKRGKKVPAGRDYTLPLEEEEEDDVDALQEDEVAVTFKAKKSQPHSPVLR